MAWQLGLDLDLDLFKLEIDTSLHPGPIVSCQLMSNKSMFLAMGQRTGSNLNSIALRIMKYNT